MAPRLHRTALACALALVACRPRNRNDDAATPAIDRPHATPPPPVDAAIARSPEVWRAPEAVSAGVSNALSTQPPDGVIGVVADVSVDLAHAALRLVRWRDAGITEVARHTVGAIQPGGAIALLRRAPTGYTAVWFDRTVDAGDAARAIDLEGAAFVGDERAATSAEADAAAWTRAADTLRRRAGASELAPSLREGAVTAVVEVRASRPKPTVLVNDTVVTQGTDLQGFEPSLGLGVAEGGRRWVAVSRGHCDETRVEVYLVDGERVTLRGRYLLGTEVGVRWMRIDAHRDDALVTWYQTLIPLRIDCIRGANAPTLDDHGVRVVRVLAEGPAPAPMPARGDAGSPTDELLQAPAPPRP